MHLLQEFPLKLHFKIDDCNIQSALHLVHPSAKQKDRYCIHLKLFVSHTTPCIVTSWGSISFSRWMLLLAAHEWVYGWGNYL